MPENAFLTWYEILQDKILSAIDNLIATPVNNLIFFLSMKNNDPAPGPDAKHPYPPINNSRDQVEFKELALVGAILSVMGSIVISFYKRSREKESISNYFFFERLFPIMGNEDFIHLRSAAYFYNPDIYPIVLWMRRSWAFLTANSDFENLEKYLNERTKNRAKEIVLKDIYKKINEQLALFITEQKKYGEWSVEEKAGEWFIKPSGDYLKAWRKKKEVQDNESSTHLKEEETKRTAFSSIVNSINSRLDELGRASFAYWIGVFIFYFLPGVGVAASGIVWPPILVAGLFLVAIWATKSYASSCGNNKQLGIDVSDKENEQKTTIEFIAAVKYQILLDALLKQERKIDTLSYKKVKFRERSKESKLCKDIRNVLNRRSDLRFVRAIFNGFVIGCFTIFFSSWLLNSAALLVIGLFVTLSPATLALVAAVVALVTLSLGLAYGIYLAVQKYNEEMVGLLDAEAKFLKLQKKYSDIEIPNISLRECDRLFRRGTTNPSGWTFTKQFFKRVWTGAIRLGTGMLFLKLLPLGTTTIVLYALYGIAVIPAFYPMLVVMLAGGLLFSGWHIWQYHCASKEGQALRIMDFFLNRPYVLGHSQSSPSPNMTAENNKNDSHIKSRLRNLNLLNENEIIFKNLYNEGNRASTPTEKKCQTPKLAGRIELLRRVSSESCLNPQDLNGTQNSTATTGACQGDTHVNNIQNFGSLSPIRRKRIHTIAVSGTERRKRKQGFDQSAIEALRLNTRGPTLFAGPTRCSGHASRVTRASSPLVY